MEELLEDARVKVSVVATDIFGMSRGAILDALITGEWDGQRPAELALGQMRAKIPGWPKRRSDASRTITRSWQT